MHTSVLLDECIENLNIEEDSVMVDCTLGYAGHSSEILKKIPKGKLYAFDQDEEAIIYAKGKLEEIASNFEIIHTNFSNLQKELEKRQVQKVDGILYDLGVSSPQLDEDYRGFSFHQNAKLDMRMDRKQDLSAYEVVNTYSEQQLIDILRKYGEEKYAVSIVKGILQSRPITTTLELAEVIKNHVPISYRKDKHPARKTFQAIRIEVNKELDVLEDSVKQALELLNINGRLAVITFHSLEDKICKKIFKEVSSVKEELKRLPIIPEEYQPRFKIVKTITPSKEELENNNRSRSATLRIIERIR